MNTLDGNKCHTGKAEYIQPARKQCAQPINLASSIIMTTAAWVLIGCLLQIDQPRFLSKSQQMSLFSLQMNEVKGLERL